MTRLLLASGRYSAAIGLVGLLLLSTAILADALARSLFNAPIFGLSDLVEILTPVIVASCFPVALANRQNITIRFLGRALRPRGGQLVELFGQLAALLALVGIVWEVGRYTYDVIAYNQFTWLLRVPVWPTWVLATLLLASCVPVQAGVVRGTWNDLRAGRPLASSDAALDAEHEGGA